MESSFRCACITFFAADPRKLAASSVLPNRPFMRAAHARIFRTRKLSSLVSARGETSSGTVVPLRRLRVAIGESPNNSALVSGLRADELGEQFPHVPHWRR